MARKGKEIALGGLRIQVDPLVLAGRVLMRQKMLLAIVAVVGGVGTVGAYLRAKKVYESRSNVLIRYENFEDFYLQKLLNVAVGYLGSDLEMMIIINELDLYAKIRSRMPYEMALREIRRELGINSKTRNIEIKFKSTDPVLAQRVVAFVTERLLGKMAELNEAQFNRDLDSIQVSLRDVEPKKTQAETKLFAFANAHPEIAGRLADLMLPSSPTAAIEDEIRRAEAELSAARAGKVLAPEPGARPRNNGPEMTRLGEMEAELQRLRARFSDIHPEVTSMSRAVAEQRQKAAAERAGAPSDTPTPGLSGEEAKKARIARAEERLKDLIRQKVEVDKASIKKPQLQREYAELSLAASTYQSELRELYSRRETTRRERTVAANRFQENFQLVDPARVPEIPTEPDRNKMMITGIGITAILGLLIAAAREALRQVFVDATEFEEQTGLQVFAVLPNIKKEGA